MKTPVLYLSRRYSFSASHRLYVDSLSPEENQAIFDKCANANGHGHTYRLTVTVRGETDPETGFVVPLAFLDTTVQQHVIGIYDHRHLNLDVEDYWGLNPTGENIASCIWQRLEVPLAGNLHRVVLDETRNNRFEHMGNFDSLRLSI